jgi:hypothetical protein
MQRAHKEFEPTRHPRSAFTLIELVCFLMLVAFAIAGAGWGHGRIGGGVGYLVGGLIGLSAWFAGAFALAAIRDGFAGVPRMPRCKDGTCRGPGLWPGNYGNYELRKFGDEYDNVCAHGVRYRRRGKRFVVVNDDGTETPYLIWRPFRGWFADPAAADASTEESAAAAP